jgi:hypothetical protein
MVSQDVDHIHLVQDCDHYWVILKNDLIPCRYCSQDESVHLTTISR